ncbi:polyprenyl synthetase family protein [Candidatus Riesia pediculischaeffi]|uniref:Octaprenyl-diphosphate synthase / Dimethylallyltransferase n=1 Tax=Candidatus Riesia pediculischaeffi PTSU TaxID=1401651 RepID=A0A0C1S9G0_9ENTR|nr:polyprenyl synthetase family protein [Candidatus Riesia pediculischaeffi]KIE63906.1 Octaprenyl-diphosphate synthase / Dimethylallyltransferase [Candidatus Riesia pediculischaeffi PTSU]
MFTKLTFHQQFDLIKKQVNDLLKKHIRCIKVIDSDLINTIQYVVFGGKRIRSFFVYSIGNMLDVSHNQMSRIAASVECIHVYSLIHDDLPSMDNDDIRRGEKSCHVVFGEANAILAGNALQSLAFEILLDLNGKTIDHENHLQIIRELAIASGINGICMGQSLDISENNAGKMNIKVLNAIYYYKTVSLIKAAIRMSFYASQYQHEKNLIHILDDFSKNVGLLFQLSDDLIDLEKDQSNLQKSKKITYPILVGLNESKEFGHRLYKEAMRKIYLIEERYGFNVDMLYNITKFIFQWKNEFQYKLE